MKRVSALILALMFLFLASWLGYLSYLFCLIIHAIYVARGIKDLAVVPYEPLAVKPNALNIAELVRALKDVIIFAAADVICGKAVFTVNKGGKTTLGVYDIESGKVTELALGDGSYTLKPRRYPSRHF